MALRFKYSKRQEIPADVAGHYGERDWAFVLEVGGMPEGGPGREAVAALEETLRLARARAARQNHGMPLILGNGNTPWQSHASTLALEPSGRLLLRYINPAGPRAKRDTQQQITTKMDITNKNYILLE